MIIVEPYTPALRAEWDTFVAGSRNGTFLFNRGYMDYHADRFRDGSLLVRRDGAPVALLPANRVDDRLVSHGGLTYGGLVVDDGMTMPLMLDCFSACLDRMAAAGIREWDYKTVPAIYHRHPAEEDRYALFRAGAQLVRRDVLSVLEIGRHPAPQDRRRRGARKAAAAGLTVDVSQDWAGFWAVLEQRLSDRHDARPVHSLEEMTRLASRFPGQIRLHAVRTADGAMRAGTVIYDTGTVLHAQYIAADDEGLRLGALDLLFSRLTGETAGTARWFDFGISNERQGRLLNAGLVTFKEGFGARTVCHDHYRLTVSDALSALADWRENRH